MLDPALGRFDHVVGMDSLIHYRAPDMARTVAGLAALCTGSVLFTFAPRTPLLTVMHTAGQTLPARRPLARDRTRHRQDHPQAASPPIPAMSGVARPERSERISSGFYISCAQEMVHA